jgi:type IV pilus assembly protein PilE
MKKTAGGFTLVELMIVVTIVAILAVVALPSYDRYMERSRRADAQQFMMQMEVRQKQILLEQRAYATAPNALNVAGEGWTCGASDCQNRFYTITFFGGVDNAATPPSYLICAIPKAGSQASDGTLTLHSAGAKQRLTGTACQGGTDRGW